MGESRNQLQYVFLGKNSSYPALIGGDDSSMWGSFGNFKIQEIYIKGDWDGKVPGTRGGIKMMHSAQ